MRVKRGKAHLKRRKNILAATKGYMWGRKSKLKLAKTAAVKAGAHAFNDRRKKKSEARAIWMVRLNAAVRPHGLTYSRFISAVKAKNIVLDRKILAKIATEYPKVFESLLEKVK